MPNLGQQALAEAVGTFALIFVGGGSIMAFLATGSDPGADAAAFVGVALAHGLTIAVMVTATGHISGGHLNPAVTLGLFAGGRVRPLQAVVYIVAQIVGATLAAALLLLTVPSGLPRSPQDLLGAATPDLGAGISGGQGVLIEAVLTFFLVFVIAGTAVDDRSPARIGGLAIGFTVLLDILIGGRLTGAAMNPARAFGPALVSGHWGNHAIYWVGPILGGVIAGIVYSYMLMEPRPTTAELRPGREPEEAERRA